MTSYIFIFCTLQLDLTILLNVGLYDFFTDQTLPNQTVGDSCLISFFNYIMPGNYQSKIVVSDNNGSGNNSEPRKSISLDKIPILSLMSWQRINLMIWQLLYPLSLCYSCGL